MADTYQSYSNAGQTTFSVPFPYLNKSHVKVYKGRDIVADTQTATLAETSGYTFNTSGTQITLTSALGSGEVLTIERQTPSASQLSPWSDGSNLTAEELNNADLQNLYIVQEQKDKNSLAATEARTATTNSGNAVSTANAAQTTANAALSRGGGTMTGAIAMGTNKVTGVGDPTAAQDAVTKAYLERTGSIQSAQIQDGTIVNNDVNANAAIDGTKVNPNFGSQNIVTSGTVDGRDVSADGIKLDSCDIGAKDDQTPAEIRTAVEAATNSNVYTDAEKTKLAGCDTGAKDDQTPAEIRTAVEAANDSNVFTDADHTKLNAAVTLTGSETLTNKTLTSPVINDMSGTAVVTSGTSTSDTKTYSAKRAGEIFYGKDTVGEIQSGESWSAADDKVATTAAIDARIVDLVDDVGGFVPIANETSFPNANPDVNNGAGTLISIKALSSNLVSNGSGVATIANGTVGNSTVTITGLANSTTYSSAYGMIVETTTTLNTYTFHRQVPIATEVNTVASNISNVNAVGNNTTNINTVAGNTTNINTVAGANSNITSVAGSISNVNTVATNISNVNDFSDKYRVASSAPTSSLDVGDLYFDTSANELKVYNGSAWQGGVTATGNLAGLGANTFTGNQSLGDNLKVILGTGNDLTVWHNGTNSYIQNTTGDLFIESGSDIFLYNGATNEYHAKFIANGASELYYDNSKKLATHTSGVNVTGRILASGTGGYGYLADDDVKIGIGTGKDLQIYHNSSNNKSYIEESGAGNLVIRGSNIDILSGDGEAFVTGAANGAVELYYDNSKKLETTSSGASVIGELDVSGNIDLNSDSAKIFIGNGNDLQIYHDGSHSYLNNYGGSLRFSDAGSEKFRISGTGTYFNDDIFLSNDNDRLNIGAGNDIQLWHNGTNSNLRNFTGDMNFTTTTNEIHNVQTSFQVKPKGGDEDGLKVITDGAVELYYDGTKKLETTSHGIKVLGSEGQNAELLLAADEGDDNADNWRIKVDTNGQLEISNYASGSYEKNIECNGNGNVELYYDNSMKFETTNSGVRVTGQLEVVQDYVKLNDNVKAILGNGNDLQIYHAVDHNKIACSATGPLYIQASATEILNVAGTQFQAKFIDHGAVELYHNDAKKFETTSGGINVIGSITQNGAAVGGGVWERISSVALSSNNTAVDLTWSNGSSIMSDYEKLRVEIYNLKKTSDSSISMRFIDTSGNVIDGSGSYGGYYNFTGRRMNNATDIDTNKGDHQTYFKVNTVGADNTTGWVEIYDPFDTQGSDGPITAFWETFGTRMSAYDDNTSSSTRQCWYHWGGGQLAGGLAWDTKICGIRFYGGTATDGKFVLYGLKNS